MLVKKNSNNRLVKLIFGCFFSIMVMFSGLFSVMMTAPAVYAVPETGAETTESVSAASSATCEDSLGALGWLVCPTTGKISEAVDWLYEKIEDILVINPVFAEDGQPIYEIWKYFRGVTNIVFIIFLLVVIYSQITGYGINNYGLKRSLPKLIVAAVLVNLSFIICSLAVDVSNVIGNGLRGLFESIETATMSSMAVGAGGSSHVAMAEMYSAMAGGTALAIGGGVVAFEAGAIWMLIPVALGAIVAVAAGLITIALRQAVVALLIMVAPLAMVAYILPNTEKWFRQWKQLLTKMLVFYPAFSLLFGASSLAGWAIIVSSSDGFGLLLGTAVQIFPLFFSWKMMKMSGTFLETINSGVRRLAAGPLATNRAWASSHRDLTKAKNLASSNVYTPTLKLRQFLENRKVARGEETSMHLTTVKNRGLEYNARRNYKGGDLDGTLSRRGQRAYEDQARNMQYQRSILRHTNNMDKGFGYRAKAGTAEQRQLDALDMMNVNASDMLKTEQARTERIQYENAVGLKNRMQAAMDAHLDEYNRYVRDTSGKLKLDANGNLIENLKYKSHFTGYDTAEFAEAAARYAGMSKIMEGSLEDVQYATATAVQAYDTQAKIVMTKFQKYFELTPPTKDVENRIREISLGGRAVDNIDAIISGLRVVNQRGDTDIVKHILDDVLDEGVDLGSHASQSLASFLMFEVKDNDPFLRRFGKYINLETARIYNANDRKESKITYDEYVKGYHVEPDGKIMYAKRPMSVLVEGTSLDSIERTALSNLDESLQKVYTDENGKLNVEEWLKKREEIQTAFGPQFISASLKYLSGSEQLKSAVSFLTGYSYKQVKDGNGDVMTDADGNPVYEWESAWSDKKYDDGEKAMMEEYFRGKTEQYFKDQTPTQILGMRSDYKNPVIEHMVESWLSDPEHPERRAEYNSAVAEIQNSYGELSAEQAQSRRKSDLAKLRNDITGRQIRDILTKSGKLEQIYRTRRSGAANNAKDWLRGWLDLDDEVKINETLRKNREERKKQQDEARRAEGDSSDEAPAPHRVYDESSRDMFTTEIEDLYTELRDEDEETFYEESMAKVQEWLGKSNEIARLYKEFHDNNPYAESYDFREYLKSLLQDPDNYPDANAY